MKRIALLFLCLAAGTASQAALMNDSIPSSKSNIKISPDDPEILAIDKALVANYLNHFCYSSDKNLLNAHGYTTDQVPTFSPEIISERMKALDAETPFDLVYNNTVQGFIDLYSIRRRDISTKVLGMSQLYFPLFEEALAKYEIPLEMKYLAIVESALNPSAISSAGAGGLWQFMVGTGKMYGLDVNSYQDERFDAYKSTDAACKYLKSLYNTFGDWQLALAAYNSGPGNVNKAIRRSGGKRDFWEIKPFLPKETQGYVPAFIAVNYVMNYASEHNLYPANPTRTFYEVDSIHVKGPVNFNTLSFVLGVPVDEIAQLNCTYKLREIPNNNKKHYLILPTEKIGLFMKNEELVYEQSREEVNPATNMLANNPEPSKQPEKATNTTVAANNNSGKEIKKTVWEESWKTHSVKRGESLGSISDKYDVSLANIKKWNKIKGSKIVPGQRLKIQTKVKKTITVNAQEEENTASATPTPQQEEERSEDVADNAPSQQTASPAKAPEKAKEKTSAAPKYKYYTVQPGDTLWDIAAKHDGVSIEQIKKLNSGLKENKLAVGQKIKIKIIG